MPLVATRRAASGTAIVCLVRLEVIGPDVVRRLRTQPATGAVIEPEPGPYRLLLGDPRSSPGQAFEPFALPDPLDPAVVRMPIGVTEHAQVLV